MTTADRLWWQAVAGGAWGTMVGGPLGLLAGYLAEVHLLAGAAAGCSLAAVIGALASRSVPPVRALSAAAVAAVLYCAGGYGGAFFLAPYLFPFVLLPFPVGATIGANLAALVLGLNGTIVWVLRDDE